MPTVGANKTRTAHIFSRRLFRSERLSDPEMRDGRVSERYEVEVRGEYHYYTGDKTWDIVGRCPAALLQGARGIEVELVLQGKNKMTPETRDERFAVDTESRSNITATSLSAPFSKSEKREMGRCDHCANIRQPAEAPVRARFTDAASTGST